MKIAFVLTGLGAGGAERVVSLLARHWIAQGHDVEIIAFDKPDSPVFHSFPAEAAFIRLAGSGPRYLPQALRRLFALRATLKVRRPHVAISFLTKNNVLALLARIGLNQRLIVCERNNPERQDASPIWNTLTRLLYPSADGIVMQTQDALSCLAPALRPRASIIPNPIAALERTPRPPRPRRSLVAVGRLVPQKGFDLLIAAFAMAAPANPDWDLVIYGEGPEAEALAGLAAHYNIAGRVRLAGRTAAPVDWVNEADAFVLSSRFEGFPNVLGEAMAAGLPSVAFDCPFGPADMITDGADGRLVAEGDVAGLGDALGALMADGAERDRLGAAASISIRRFSEDAVTPLWDALLARTR